MGLNGLEPSTSRLSGGRSNQLSYRPDWLPLLYEYNIDLSKLNKEESNTCVFRNIP